MKKASDPRHKQRISIVQQLFAYSFREYKLKQDKIKLITQNLEKIDKLIEEAAPAWSIEKIAKIDLAILRLSIYELTIDRKEPSKVVIDEAVELGKSLGNDRSPSFINGVLGTIFKKLN